MNIYYKIWVDCIGRTKSVEESKHKWKGNSMFIMTTTMTFNFAFLLAMVERHIISHFYYIEIDFLPQTLNSILTIGILFVLPIYIINYLLIFRKKRYEKLIEKYPYKNGKLIIPYSIISIMLPVVLVLVFVFFIQEGTKII